ncbi:Transport protein particle subunit [Pseudocercospora fuligena]|uniref:Transport protein particle subunit n=1 Tax=Pseudocercospora fuligena TaxID=685502 RepID=A0A8H6RV91_9PEZI|nr:Transport protein particle subunit [Pseudocercospora fuligena]
MDNFSTVRPAQISVLVLGVGQITRDTFTQCLRRLQQEASVLPLADLPKPGIDADGAFLLPRTSARGSLIYSYSSSVPSTQQAQLSPYELYREPLLVLGVVDGRRSGIEDSVKELEGASAYLKERHPRVVHRQLVVLAENDEQDVSKISNAIAIRNIETPNDPSLRVAISLVSARFLVEFSTYAKAVQASPTIQTPGQTARNLQRTSSLRDDERRARTGSGAGTPVSAAVSSPTDEGSPSRFPKAPPHPATSFDQIPGAGTSSNTPRPDSRSSNQSNSTTGRSKRAASQDRVSVQGFGSSTSQEKARVRGKARVGIVLGSIYMMAGHWSDALSILVEHTNKARSLGDHLWHAKGLEHLLVCMILLAWSGTEFQVPSICDPVAERTGSSTLARSTADARLAAEGMQRQIVRLSVVIPDLVRLILSLYRSGEGALELPFLVHSEAAVRASRLLTILISAGGELTPAKLRPLILNSSNLQKSDHEDTALTRQSSGVGRSKLLSKAVVADILAQALPSSEDGLSTVDHIRTLAGIASSYAVLGFARKKAIVIKELVIRLTQALIQARKLGAAEMGIHPAASLSVESGAETLLSIAEESGGINDLMSEISDIYGAALVPANRADPPSYIASKAFGNPALKRDLLRDLSRFCEASPDPYGVLSLTTSLLRIAGPSAAIGVSTDGTTNLFTREDQTHLATVIHRTVAVSRHLGLTDVQAVYWDLFLVRKVEILQPAGQRAVIDKTKIHMADKVADQPLEPGNPFLYDPSASRPGTAAKQTFLLVQNEESECIITLQNPFDIPVDIESLELVTEGVELHSHHMPTTLGPLRFQQVVLMVSPKSAGTTKISGCRVKMQGCYPQIFPIVLSAWTATEPLTLKDLGLAARAPQNGVTKDLKELGIEPELISATVIDELPTLTLENTAQLQSGLMLLEGESRSLELVLRNTGKITATVFEATDTGDVLRRDDEHKLKVRGLKHKRSKSFLPTTTVRPGDCITFRFRVEGRAGLSNTQANFYYSAADAGEAKHVRVVSAPVVMTVNAALQVHNLDITPSREHEPDSLLVAFDIRNAWPKSVFYECFNKMAPRPQDMANAQEGQLSPGEIRRIHLDVHHNLKDMDYEDDIDSVRRNFLDQLHVSWRVEEHSGYVDLLSQVLSPESLEMIRGSPVNLVLDIANGVPSASVGAFVTITAKLSNRGKPTGPLSVQLIPRKTDSAREERQLATAGTLRRILSPIAEGESTTVEFVLCPLLAGRLEIDGIARPAQIGRHIVNEQWTSRRTLSIEVR